MGFTEVLVSSDGTVDITTAQWVRLELLPTCKKLLVRNDIVVCSICI